jgi:hypothetical protein
METETTHDNLVIGDTSTIMFSTTEDEHMYVQTIHPLRKPVDRAIALIFHWRNSGDEVKQKCANQLERALLSYEGDTDPDKQIWLYPEDYPENKGDSA